MAVSRTPVVAGIGISDYPKAPHLTSYGHHAQAMQRALADCGLTKDDIDGYMTVGMGGLHIDGAATMAEYLGIRPKWMEGTQFGGSAAEAFVDHAAEIIRSGYCDTVLITYGSDLRSNKRRSVDVSGSGLIEGPRAWELPFGPSIIGNYAMAARRHMHEFGTTLEQLAEIAVSSRLHAMNNPHALNRGPLSIEDVVTAPRLADPLGLYDVCGITDGGGAVIITTQERARDLRQKPVFILGCSTSVGHWNISQMPDFTTTGAAICGPRAFAKAGVTPDQIDTAQIYDSFTITVLLMLEGLGFCARGEGGAFVADGKLRPGGLLPVNTDGGGLSSSHTGMRGMFLLTEAVLQLRGQAAGRQVPDARLALACGAGGVLSCISTIILGNEQG